MLEAPARSFSMAFAWYLRRNTVSNMFVDIEGMFKGGLESILLKVFIIHMELHFVHTKNLRAHRTRNSVRDIVFELRFYSRSDTFLTSVVRVRAVGRWKMCGKFPERLAFAAHEASVLCCDCCPYPGSKGTPHDVSHMFVDLNVGR